MHAATYLPTIRIVASEPHPHPCPSPAGRGVRSITSLEKTGSFYHLPREDGFVLSPPSRRRVRFIASPSGRGRRARARRVSETLSLVICALTETRVTRRLVFPSATTPARLPPIACGST